MVQIYRLYLVKKNFFAIIFKKKAPTLVSALISGFYIKKKLLLIIIVAIIFNANPLCRAITIGVSIAIFTRGGLTRCKKYSS